MPIQLKEEDGGKICLVQVSGELISADYAHLVSKFERLVRQHGKLRVMYDMRNFRGWDAGALWAEVRFDVKHFKDIIRCAAVGDQRWQKRLTEFCEPFTAGTIRYFDSVGVAAARKWLGESIAASAA